MEEQLRSWLLANPGVTALVGTRVDWGTRPQGDSLPAVVLHLISEQRPMNLAEPGVWQDARVQVDCWGRTFKAARDVGNAIAGPADGIGIHGLRVLLDNIRVRIFVLDRASDQDRDSEGVLHRTRLDLNIWWARLQGD